VPESLQRLLDEGVESGVFPSAAAVVLHEGRLVFEGAAAATPDTVFDLASLTKPVVASAFLSLWAEGRIGPDAPLARFRANTPLAQAGATVADLLFHRSGLPAGQPFFAAVMHAVPELFAPDCPVSNRAEIRQEVALAAWHQPLEGELGQAAVYSDIGFIVLGEILAAVNGQPLDALIASRVTGPLGLSLRYHRLSTLSDADTAQPTGSTRPREPAPGQENRWKELSLRPTRAGEVDDDNAWVMDGVSGHAGLFGSARAVARFGQAVLEGHERGNPLAPAPLWQLALRRDPKTPGSTRAMGFDTPAAQGSSAGSRFGQRAPGAGGHLGFTGTSLWIDLSRKLVVALLTNRTALGRANVRIQSFRPRFHEAVIDSFGP
jgi:CubicO group peptidase (beta-lactamase class C family)